MLVTEGWDNTLKYWDNRQQNPAFVYPLPDRCYALSVRHPLMVVGTADKNLIIFNLQNPQVPQKWSSRSIWEWLGMSATFLGCSVDGQQSLDIMFTEFKRMQSPFKHQTRCVAAFPDKTGFLINKSAINAYNKKILHPFHAHRKRQRLHAGELLQKDCRHDRV
ncbi:hypothetical protein SUGI_1194280 [Cryptomeria japonica]|nr:hypothetical protein SUGI_1194280 [Cryptomeria japonica]